MPYYYGFPFRFGPGPCCCPEECWTFEDDFNDSDTTDVPNWNEVHGDWGIDNYHLVEKYGGGGTGGSIIICEMPQPEPNKGEQQIRIEVHDYQTGDKFYIYPCCEDVDRVGPVEVEFHCTNSPSAWTVTINGDESGVQGANVTLYGMGHYYTILHVCADNLAESVKAWVQPLGTTYDKIWDDDLDPGTGRYVGLGHNNTTNGAIFDNFYFLELRAGDIICSDCFCWCLEEVVPKELTLTIVNATGRASCMEGYSCTLTYEWNAGSPRWKGGFTVTYGVYTQSFEWCVTCLPVDHDDPDHQGKNLILTLCGIYQCCNSWPGICGGASFVPIAGMSYCDPMKLVYGPFTVADSELNCFLCGPPGSGSGSWYIEITE